MAQIICRDAHLGYDGKIFTEGLSFQVEAGDYLCIVGENGAGKSTLIKAILKLIAPVKGEIRMEEGTTLSEIGYLPQQTALQKDFPASVREVVMSGCAGRCGLKPFYGKAEKQKAAEIMERLGITYLRKKCYRDLSGGQQQRVLLARALLAARKILLLDEPTAGLDPLATKEMYSIISELNRKEGMTVIMVTHDIDAAVRYSKSILHLGEGQAFFGATGEYLKSSIGKEFFRASGGNKDE